MRSKLLLWFLIIVLAASAVMFLPNFADFELGQVAFLVALVILMMTIGIKFRAEKRLPILCDPLILFFAFQAQFYIAGPLLLPVYRWAWQYRITHETVLAVLGAFLVMLAAFIAGYQSRLGVMLAEWVPDFREGKMKAPGQWFEYLVLGLSLFGCFLYLVDRGGLFGWMRQGYGAGKNTSALFLIPFNALMLGTLLTAWRFVRTKRLSVLVFLASFLLVEVIFFGFLFGVRKQLFFLFFGLFGIWLLHRPHSKAPRYVALALVPPLLFYFSLWGMLRPRPVEDILAGRSDPSFVKSGPFYEGYVNGVAEPFAVACLVHNVFPNTEPYRYGQTLLVTLLGFIPRAVWADKPIGLGKHLTKYTDGVRYTPVGGHSVTPTLLGDFYANLGWTGALIGGLLFGVLCRTVATYGAKGMERGYQDSAARVLIAAVFLAGLVEVRSDTATILAFYFLNYPVLLVGLLFFRFDYEERGSPAEVPAPSVTRFSPVPARGD